MKKKVMAVAVAGVLAAPALAFAQASTVQIYGYLNAEYGFANGMQKPGLAGTSNSWDGLNSGASYLGFKGEEKLGSGMSAFFQCETDVGFLKGDQATSTLAPATQNGWCGRNSAIGMKGGWGSFYVGSWDSPMKRAVGSVRVVGETGWHGVQSLLISNGGAFTGSFSVRNSNSINWDSPNWNGFSAALQTTSTKAASSVTTAGLKGRSTAFSVNYASGPMLLVTSYVVADDNRSTAANPSAGTPTVGGNGARDKAWMLGGSYVWGPAKLALMYVKGEVDAAPTVAAIPLTSNLRRTSWNLAGTYNFGGPHSAFMGYTVAGDTKYTGTAATPAATGNDTGAKEWQIGYNYAFSKRTTGGLSYAHVSNDTFATGYSVGAQSSSVFAGSSSHVFVTRDRKSVV